MNKQERKEFEKAKVLIVHRRPHGNEVRYWRHNYHWPDQWETCSLAEWVKLKQQLTTLGIKILLLEDSDHATEQAELEAIMQEQPSA